MLIKTVPKSCKILCCLLFVSWQSGVGANFRQDDQDIYQFLELTRNPPVQKCWAKLSGKVRYKSKRQSKKNIPIEIRAHLTEKGITAQITFNRLERYLIEQKFNGDAAEGTNIRQEKKGTDGADIASVGLRPSDLTLSFLYWNFDQEYPRERVRGQDCRVTKLLKPDGNEFVVVWISKKYFFPLRVQWFQTNDPSPFRTLEFTGFEKIDNAWVIKELKIKGADWKTIVKLKADGVHAITPKDPMPKDLFLSN